MKVELGNLSLVGGVFSRKKDPFWREIMQMSINRKRVLFFLFLTISACTTSSPTTTSVTPTVLVTATPADVVAASRYGTITIPSVDSSGVTGILTAKDNSDGSTSLSIQLTPTADFNPWGIYNLGDCINGVPIDTRPIFSLPDIENGYKEETLETDAYKSTPGNLIVVVYGISPDGTQQMIACTDLGPPLMAVKPSPPTSTSDCAPQAATAPRLESGTWLA